MGVSPLLSIDELREELADVEGDLVRLDSVDPYTPDAARRLYELRETLEKQRDEHVARIADLER